MRSFAWVAMTLLAQAVAAYAITMMAIPALRPPFLNQLIVEVPWLAMTHFFAGAVALSLGAFQFHAGLRARLRTVHRWSGRLYVGAVIASGIAGLALAVRSPAGFVAQTGFGLLALAWLYTTTQALLYIRSGDVRSHKDWMTRSYALTLAAVTLRIYLPGSQIAGFSWAVAYPTIAWISWAPNLLLAEWMIRARWLHRRR